MNVPFPLPAYFKATKRFNRDLKKLSVSVWEEVAEAVAGIVRRSAKEKHKPRKRRSEKDVYIVESVTCFV
jgi:putative lipoic acid-binding regulatory protein